MSARTSPSPGATIPEARQPLDATDSLDTADHEQGTAEQHDPGRVPDVPAWAFRPSGRRQTWLLLVTSCPYCGGYAHAHRGDRRGGVRESGCRRGVYRLVPTGRGWAA